MPFAIVATRIEIIPNINGDYALARFNVIFGHNLELFKIIHCCEFVVPCFRSVSELLCLITFTMTEEAFLQKTILLNSLYTKYLRIA